MAWASKRPGAKVYSALWRDEHGRQRQAKGYSDKRATEKLAQDREDECGKVRDGQLDPAERTRRDAAGKSLGRHIDDFRDSLLAQDNTATYCRSRASTVRRLFKDAGIDSLPAITKDAILSGLATWKEKGRSARTLNDALGAAKEFCGWLADADLIPRLPKGLKRVARYNEDADRRLVRRALTRDELARLLAAAESGATWSRKPAEDRPSRKSSQGGTGAKGRMRDRPVTGPDRAALYRAAMATGYRANELRSLVRESFRLDGPEPAIVLDARFTKNGRDAEQPITREVADALRPAVEACAPGARVLVVPEKTAKLLRIDLAAAGIPFRTGEGVCDFHALRTTYITLLIEGGSNIKVVQALSRHADPSLTIKRYIKLRDGDKRRAVEGKGT